MQNQKVIAIIFSYNRAAQLDALLRSIKAFFRFPEYEIAIVYLVTPEHALSYRILMEKYAAWDRIRFHEVRDQGLVSKFFYPIPFLLLPWNAYWWIKHTVARDVRHDLKAVTEGILKRSQAQFAMFVTDDTVFYRPVSMPASAAALIQKHPFTYSFRCYIGRNIQGCPDVDASDDDVLAWDYYAKQVEGHWAYPFSVDSTIYARKALLLLSRSMFYNLPSTLEAFGVSLCRHLKLFRKGLSSILSTHLNLILNCVQQVTKNDSMDIDVEELCRAFEASYELHYILPETVSRTPCRDIKAILRRGTEEMVVCG